MPTRANVLRTAAHNRMDEWGLFPTAAAFLQCATQLGFSCQWLHAMFQGIGS